MAGRYGGDQFSRFLSFAALVALLIGAFGSAVTVLHAFWYLGLAILIYNIFRMFSRNYTNRRKELDWYYRTKNKVKSFFNLQKRKWQERKTHVFYTCPKCKATVRVPKGKGQIEITCPKCKEKFIRRT